MTKNPPEASPFTQIVLVTPEQAKDWLASNTRNRPLSMDRVRKLAAVMSQGRFLTTHQGIAFDVNNLLQDGQHRLQAIVLSGVSCRMSVTWGVDPNAVEVIDIGRARSAGQTLSIQGVPGARDIASLSRAALHGLGRGPERGSRYTDVLEFARKHLVTASLYIPVARKVSASVGGAFLRAELVGMFGMRQAAHRLVTLEFSGDGDPMRALANRLRDKHSDRTRYACTVTALRAIDEKRTLKVVKDATADLPEIP